MPQPDDGVSPDFWDLVVRLSHWVIAAVVLDNALLTKGGSALHVWLGWTGMVFLGVRLIWGLLGSAEARFAAFPPQPRAALIHLIHLIHLLRRRPREYRSHNPAGAMMICALWAMLAMVIGTGLFLTKAATPWEIGRQQAAVAADDWSALVVEADTGTGSDAAGAGAHLVATLHQLGGNLLLLMAVLHLGGVAVESVALRRNLLLPMVSGRRR